MKKTVFFLVFSSIVLTGFGQTEQALKTFKLGVSTNVSQLNLTDYYEWRDFLCFEGCGVSDFGSGHSFSVGLTGSFGLSNKVEVLTGLEYAQKSYYEEGFDFFSQYRIRRNLKYLQIPVIMRYKFYSTETQKIQTYVDLGVNGLFNINQGKEEATYEDSLKDLGFNVQSGLGLAINFEKFTLAVGPQFSYAISNLGANGHTDGPDKNKLRPYEIGLGISIFK